MSNSVPFILTTEQLAQAFGTTPKIISQNFQRHPDDFQEGTHYYLLEGDQLQQFLSEKNANFAIFSEKNAKSPDSKIRRLYLWTQKGAFAHAWILKSPGAKAAYEHLIELAEKPQVPGVSQEVYTALADKYETVLKVVVDLVAVEHLNDSDLGHEQLDDIETVLYRVREELKKLSKTDALLPVLTELEKLLSTLETMIVSTDEKLEQTDKQFIDQAAFTSRISADLQLLTSPLVPLLASPKN